MTPEDGQLVVLGRRLDALQRSIAARAPWHEIDFIYDQVRSSFDRMSGQRNRHYDNSKENRDA